MPFEYADTEEGHVLRREPGEPQHLGECERCGLSNVVAGAMCSEDFSTGDTAEQLGVELVPLGDGRNEPVR